MKENENREILKDSLRFCQIKFKFVCLCSVYSAHTEFFYSDVKLTVLFKYWASVINGKNLCGEPAQPEKGSIKDSKALGFGSTFYWTVPES